MFVDESRRVPLLHFSALCDFFWKNLDMAPTLDVLVLLLLPKPFFHFSDSQSEDKFDILSWTDAFELFENLDVCLVLSQELNVVSKYWMSVKDFPTVVIFRSRRPCSMSASDVAAVLAEFWDFQSCGFLKLRISFGPEQLRMRQIIWMLLTKNMNAVFIVYLSPFVMIDLVFPLDWFFDEVQKVSRWRESVWISFPSDLLV